MEKKEYKTFCVTLEQFVPEDHLVRKLDQLMEYGWIGEKLSAYYPLDSNPSPMILIKLVLIQHLYLDDHSLAYAYDTLLDNMALRWFLGFDLLDKIPPLAELCGTAFQNIPADCLVEILSRILGNVVIQPLCGADGADLVSPIFRKRQQKMNAYDMAELFYQDLANDMESL